MSDLPDVESLLGARPTEVPEGESLLGLRPSAPPSGFSAGRTLWTGADADAFHDMAEPIGRVLRAFGQGAMTAWESGENLGYSDDVTEAMKKAGIYTDVAKKQGGLLRTFNEALIRPPLTAALVTGGALARGFGAAIAGGQAAVAQTGEEVGAPQLGRELAAIPEAFPLGGLETGLHTVPTPPRATAFGQELGRALSAAEIEKAAELGVIGPGGRAAWQDDIAAQPMRLGVSPVTATQEQITADINPRIRAAQEAARKAEAGGLPAPEDTPVPTVHDAARKIDPDTFAAYDPLAQKVDEIRQRIADSKEQQRAEVQAAAPGAAEIADLEARLQDTTPRLAKKYQARLDALRPAYEDYLDDHATLPDTPEQMAMRQEMMAVDYQMRDLAPKVSAAYREAAKSFPEPEAVQETVPEPVSTPPVSEAPERLAPVPETAAPNRVEPRAIQPEAITRGAEPAAEPVSTGAAPSPEPAAPISTPAPEPAKPVEPTPPTTPINIAEDTARKLVAAGRPADEAQAAGQVTEALWKARADAFGGAKGTAEEMYARDAPDVRARRKRAKQREYARDAPDVRAGRKRAKQREYAQTKRGAIKLTEDGRAVITLFKNANASTFLHETGHDWLERMMRDAADPDAAPHMARDAETVRAYLGNDGGDLTTEQHEKFGRSFERYFMEGHAPSSALARVFEQFKDWLTQIYQTVTRLRAPITDDIRDVFDRLLGGKEPGVVAPEAQGWLFDKSPEPANPLYAKVPKEPERLINFLRRGVTQFPGTINETKIPGGLKDTGGDVAAIVGGPKGRPGLINVNGSELHNATERAHEAGYFPEFTNGRPDENDLLRKIAEDHRGNPQYSMHDQEAVDAYNHAIESNAEIDRLASQYDIDTAGLTRDQFFDKLAEAQSIEDIANTIRDSEDTGFDEFDAEVRDFTKPPWYGMAEPRSLEDLENEARQENAARSGEQGARDTEGPGHAGGFAEPGEGDNRQDASGAGTASGGGTEVGEGRDQSGDSEPAGPGGSKPLPASEQPASPHSTVEQPPKLVDKAGNIRLDNLNSDEDVKQVLRDLAAQNDDFMDARGGVIPDVQRRAMADSLGLTFDNFNAQKPDGVSSSVWAEAVQKLAFQASDQVARLGKAFGESGSPQDAAAYLAAKQRLLIVADHFAGLTAESGRTQRVFNKAGFTFTGDMVAAMQRDTGRTLYQLQQEARAVGEMETTAQRAKMVQDTRDLTPWQKIKAGIISYFINNLISGPITHAAYMAASGTWSLFKAVPLTLAEATIDEIRGAEGARVHYGEVGAQLYGMARGAWSGLAPGWKAFKSGISYMEGADRLAEAGQQGLPGVGPAVDAIGRQSAISDALQLAKVPAGVADKVGYVLETPSRGVSAIHTVFYSMNYARDIARRAFRTAAAEGLEGDAFNLRVAQLTQNPDLGMIQAAHNEALNAVLMKSPEYGSAQQKIVSVINQSLPLKLAMPFMQIGMNILDEGLIQSTPLGIASQAVRDKLFGKDEIAKTQQYARIMVGSGVVAGIMGAAAQGIITGAGPSDPKELALRESTGWKPYSIRIGDTYIPMRKYLGPLGPLVGGAANIYEVSHLLAEGEMNKAIGTAVLGFSEAVANETWMAGLANLVDATMHWDKDGEKYLRNLAMGFIPGSVGMGQVARMVDPYQREVHSMTDALRNKIPGLSESLYPQRNWRGEPIDSHVMLTAGTDRHDTTEAAMEAAEFYPARIRRDVNGVPLTDKQYDDLSRVAGHLTSMRMDSLVRGAGFTQMPLGIQRKMMAETLAGSRKVAEDWLRGQPENANIIRQANAAKTAALTGALPEAVKDIRRGR